MMKTGGENDKVFQLVSLALAMAFLVSSGSAIYFYKQSKGKDLTIAKVKLDKEKFLSEKLATDKVVYQQEKELAVFEELKIGLEGLLAEKASHIIELEKRIARMKKGHKSVSVAKKEPETTKWEE